MFETHYVKSNPLPIQAGGAVCASVSGAMMMIGSADGSLALRQTKLDVGSPPTPPSVLHDMWAGESVSWPDTKL